MQFRELTERYQLQKILKSTRFGTVLRATDLSSGRQVAVKLVTPGVSPGLAAGAPEIERLAAALSGLRHPNLPAVLDSGFTTDGSAFLALELLEGQGFDTLAGAPPARLLSLVGQALEGLEALAGCGLAHHNVSPDNLFVVPEGGGERVVLLGLGTAVFRPRGLTGVAPENARFLAPELSDGGAADGRADLYSLALTACQALGATVGFGEPPVVQLPLAVSFELESDEALRRALERSLRSNPGERPEPRDFREALRLAIGEAAAPAAGPAAAPEFSLPDPLPAEEDQGNVLSEVNDEILNALLAVPPPPPRPPAPNGSGGPERIVPAAIPVQSAPTSVPFFRRPAVLGAVAGAVVLCVLAAVWLRHPQPQPAPSPAPPSTALPKPILQPLPEATDPEDLRDQAAAALEAQADALVQNARYPEALAVLAPLRRTWPGRAGLAERIARYEAYQREETAQEALLAALPSLERRKKPWEGLQALKEFEPTPHLKARFAAARTRLEALLAQLDKEPPRIVLRDGYLLEYARGTVAELSFRATDDYQVERVKLMARPPGGKFRNLPLETTRTGYSTLRIDPAFHRNGTVDLYLVATDLSGHEGHFGSPDKPLQLKRKQGFERLIR